MPKKNQFITSLHRIKILNQHCRRILMCACLILLASTLQAKDTIVWRVVDWPPFYILEGPDKGKGIYDEMITMIARHLPEYDHQTIIMNTQRVRAEWRKGINICHPSVIVGSTLNTQSVINSILLPHRVITFKEQETLFTKNVVSLNKVLGDKNLYGGIIPGRYSNSLNKLIETYKDQKHLYTHPNYEQLIKLLLLKRLDYIIEYPPIITYTAKQMKLNNTIKSISIAETQDSPYVKVAVGCTDNTWGRAIIKKINLILLQESQDPTFLESRLNWYDDSSKVILRKLYQDIYFKDKSQFLE